MDLGPLRPSEVHGSSQFPATSQEGRNRQQTSLCQTLREVAMTAHIAVLARSQCLVWTSHH